MNLKRRVVVTGLGLISPIGNSAIASWKNATEGKSGAELITKFDTENFLTKFGATVKNFEDLGCIEPKEARRTDLFMAHKEAAKLTAVVVFPTPPFWFAITKVLTIISFCFYCNQDTRLVLRF